MVYPRVEKYLASRAITAPWALAGIQGKHYAGAVVIPSLAESNLLFSTLRSLAQNPRELLDRFLVLVVVNHRQDIAEYVKRFDVPPVQQNPPIMGQILLAAPHPDNFLPYQYEGYTYEQRTILRRLKPDMRLYKAADDFTSGINPIWTGMKNCWVNE